MSRIIDLDDYASEMARELTIKVLEGLDNSCFEVGGEYRDELTIHFITHFVGAVVYRVLTEKLPDKAAKKEKEKIKIDQFANFKYGMQEAVAFGFQSAMQIYSKKSIEYYCKISPVPDPQSTQFS